MTRPRPTGAAADAPTDRLPVARPARRSGGAGVVSAIGAALVIAGGTAAVAVSAPPVPVVVSAPSAPLAATTTVRPVDVIPAVAPQHHSGTGDDVVRLTRPVEAAVLAFDCPRCTGNTVVRTGTDLLVNEIGGYTGRRLLGMRGGTTELLQVTADAPWTLTVGGPDLASAHGPADTVTGRGDDVVVYRPAPEAVRLSHGGASNFAVHAVSPGGGVDLLVNEIGPYAGAVLMPGTGADTVVVQVTADGAWTMTTR